MLNIAGNLTDLSKPKVMGILNLTPDSFYDGSKHNDVDNALRQTENMLLEGADFIDIGAYSSRPHAEEISEDEEISRLLPVLESIVKNFPEAVISVDTFRSNVVKLAVEAGANIVNDISGGELDKNMFATVVKLQVPYILMHMRGTPQNMTKQTSYGDLAVEVMDYFVTKTKQLLSLGVKDIILDPGFGFAKTREQSFELLSKLNYFKLLGFPVLAGLSRKSMIQKTLGVTAGNSLNGTTAANTIALMNGANILRVHDVKEAVEAIRIFKMLC